MKIVDPGADDLKFSMFHFKELRTKDPKRVELGFVRNNCSFVGMEPITLSERRYRKVAV
jgi:hypothetical protein